ncbi:MAG: hypothetical protein ACI9LL_000108 [Porticoccus sp.]
MKISPIGVFLKKVKEIAMWWKSAFIGWIGFYFWQEHDVSNREYQWRQRRREGKYPADEIEKVEAGLRSQRSQRRSQRSQRNR